MFHFTRGGAPSSHPSLLKVEVEQDLLSSFWWEMGDGVNDTRVPTRLSRRFLTGTR